MNLELPIAGTRAAAEYIAQRQKHPVSADAVARWCGRTPSDGWIFEDASAGAVAAIGAHDLTEGGTPTYRAATAYPQKVGITFAQGSTDKLYASSNAVFNDDGSTSFAWLIHVVIGSVGAANHSFFEKLSGGAYYFLRTDSSGENAQWYLRDGFTTKSVTVTGAVSGLDVWMYCSCDRTNALAWLATRDGSGSVDITGLGSTSNIGIFRFGGASWTPPPVTFLAGYRFEGAQAEGDPAETMRRIQRYQGGF